MSTRNNHDHRKTDQIKVAAVIILAVIAVIMAYFRFFRPTPPNAPVSESVPEVSISESLDVSLPEPLSSKGGREKRHPLDLTDPTDIRNIFAPTPLVISRDDLSPLTRKSSQPPSINVVLNGIIAGNGKNVAIINNALYRTGDKLGAYVIVGIEKNKVMLKYKDHLKALFLSTIPENTEEKTE
ncbi:MAG: hypothetical protein HKM93_22920 [Desulfobacteraceae bacterium]|nr:hypothetical protein [Desulfobacteraceae bacterium]